MIRRPHSGAVLLEETSMTDDPTPEQTPEPVRDLAPGGDLAKRWPESGPEEQMLVMMAIDAIQAEEFEPVRSWDRFVERPSNSCRCISRHAYRRGPPRPGARTCPHPKARRGLLALSTDPPLALERCCVQPGRRESLARSPGRVLRDREPPTASACGLGPLWAVNGSESFIARRKGQGGVRPAPGGNPW